jgi:hypothetical protein
MANANTCLAATNRLGICPSEPCYAQYPASFQVPAPFANGAQPAPIRASDLGFSGATSPGVAPAPMPVSGGGSGNSQAWIKNFELVDTNSNAVVTSDFSRSVYVGSIKDNMSIRVNANGNIKSVEFRIDGNSVHTESQAPFYIAGDIFGTVKPWIGAPLNTDFTLQAQAIGYDGSEDTDTITMHFQT